MVGRVYKGHIIWMVQRAAGKTPRKVEERREIINVSVDNRKGIGARKRDGVCVCWVRVASYRDNMFLYVKKENNNNEVGGWITESGKGALVNRE